MNINKTQHPYPRQASTLRLNMPGILLILSIIAMAVFGQVSTNMDAALPKFEVRSNSPTTFKVAFADKGSTNWTLLKAEFATKADAQSAIDGTKAKLCKKDKAGIDAWAKAMKAANNRP